jgi:hypothetical protein
MPWPDWVVALHPRGQYFLSSGDKYQVTAISVFEGCVRYQLLDYLRSHPNWYLSWFFEIEEGDLPCDWICSSFPPDLELVLGPPFMTHSREAYESMVGLETSALLSYTQGWR